MTRPRHGDPFEIPAMEPHHFTPPDRRQRRALPVDGYKHADDKVPGVNRSMIHTALLCGFVSIFWFAVGVGIGLTLCKGPA